MVQERAQGSERCKWRQTNMEGVYGGSGSGVMLGARGEPLLLPPPMRWLRMGGDFHFDHGTPGGGRRTALPGATFRHRLRGAGVGALGRGS